MRRIRDRDSSGVSEGEEELGESEPFLCRTPTPPTTGIDAEGYVHSPTKDAEEYIGPQSAVTTRPVGSNLTLTGHPLKVEVITADYNHAAVAVASSPALLTPPAANMKGNNPVHFAPSSSSSSSSHENAWDCQQTRLLGAFDPPDPDGKQTKTTFCSLTFLFLLRGCTRDPGIIYTFKIMR